MNSGLSSRASGFSLFSHLPFIILFLCSFQFQIPQTLCGEVLHLGALLMSILLLPNVYLDLRKVFPPTHLTLSHFMQLAHLLSAFARSSSDQVVPGFLLSEIDLDEA
jgi:hypothetical protein